MLNPRFCRLVFGLTPSPAILGAIIQHHLSQQEPQEVVNTLKDSLCVDDLTAGESTVSNAFKMYQSSKSIMARGGFNLRKWTSNSTELLAQIEKSEREMQTPVEDEAISQGICEDDRSYMKSTVGAFTTSSEDKAKILGVNWDTHTDTLFFDFGN